MVLDVAVLVPIAPDPAVARFIYDIPEDVDVSVGSYFPFDALSEKLVLLGFIILEQPQGQAGPRVFRPASWGARFWSSTGRIGWAGFQYIPARSRQKHCARRC